MAYQVNEIFSSVQGEGYWTGTPATFIRLQGCPVGCPWCDTKYTWHSGGTRMEVPQIVQLVDHHNVITGGEPTLYDLDELLKALSGTYTQLETSGLHTLKGVLRPQWVTMSPKRNLQFMGAQGWEGNVEELKYVVDETITYEDILKSIQPHIVHGSYLQVISIMPEGSPPSERSVDRALQFTRYLTNWARNYMKTSIDVRYSDRLQYRIGVR